MESIKTCSAQQIRASGKMSLNEGLVSLNLVHFDKMKRQTVASEYIMPATSDLNFSEEVVRRRADYQRLRDSSNLFPLAGRPPLDRLYQVSKGWPALVYWYMNEILPGSNSKTIQCVRIVDVSGKQSGRILRLYENLLVRSDGFEVDGMIYES